MRDLDRVVSIHFDRRGSLLSRRCCSRPSGTQSVVSRRLPPTAVAHALARLGPPTPPLRPSDVDSVGDGETAAVAMRLAAAALVCAWLALAPAGAAAACFCTGSDCCPTEAEPIVRSACQVKELYAFLTSVGASPLGTSVAPRRRYPRVRRGAGAPRPPHAASRDAIVQATRAATSPGSRRWCAAPTARATRTPSRRTSA